MGMGGVAGTPWHAFRCVQLSASLVTTDSRPSHHRTGIVADMFIVVYHCLHRQAQQGSMYANSLPCIPPHHLCIVLQGTAIGQRMCCCTVCLLHCSPRATWTLNCFCMLGTGSCGHWGTRLDMCIVLLLLPSCLAAPLSPLLPGLLGCCA
jgi:hypothetical protein